MEQETQINQLEQEQPKIDRGNHLQVGEIILGSNELEMGQLLFVLEALLDNPKVMNYLEKYRKLNLLESSKQTYC